MEDSEQRKKRLKEMRVQADLAEGVEEGSSGMPGVLSNPLAEASSTMLSPDKSYAAAAVPPRFNYYTDPMNAFSSDKRNRNNAPDYFPPPPPPPNFGGSPMPQFSESTNRQMTPSPNQVLPIAYGNPVWNGPRGPAHYNFPFRPAGGGGTYPSPRFESQHGPLHNSAQGMNQWPNPSPNPSPGYRNSPSPSQGRGRGFWHNNRSPVSGRGRGQGSSSHGRWSNEDRACGPDRFYKRSMVEDPWKFLEPVIWKATNSYSYTAHTPVNSKPWTPSKSTSSKREESSAVFVKPNSGPSLAEYLAAALDEAGNSEENV